MKDFAEFLKTGDPNRFVIHEGNGGEEPDQQPTEGTDMRVARKMRDLSNREIGLAQSVFQTSLPAWWRIKITDGLGINDRPYTTNKLPTLVSPSAYNRWEEVALSVALFYLHLGPDVYPDATRSGKLFIHEMTHVWQYYHGYWVAIRSIYAQTHFLSAGYNYTVEASDAWNDYNVEQQAHLVADWYAEKMSRTDDRFVFIEKIIRAGVSNDQFLLNSMPLEKLRRGPPYWEVDPEVLKVVEGLKVVGPLAEDKDE